LNKIHRKRVLALPFQDTENKGIDNGMFIKNGVIDKIVGDFD
jgi:hypothetical protein